MAFSDNWTAVYHLLDLPERQSPAMELYSAELPTALDMDPARQFEGCWTDRHVSCKAAELLPSGF